MGFAIPANDIVNIIKQLEEKRKSEVRPALGIQMMDLSNLSTSDLSQLKLPEKISEEYWFVQHLKICLLQINCNVMM